MQLPLLQNKQTVMTDCSSFDQPSRGALKVEMLRPSEFIDRYPVKRIFILCEVNGVGLSGCYR